MTFIQLIQQFFNQFSTPELAVICSTIILFIAIIGFCWIDMVNFKQPFNQQIVPICVSSILLCMFSLIFWGSAPSKVQIAQYNQRYQDFQTYCKNNNEVADDSQFNGSKTSNSSSGTCLKKVPGTTKTYTIDSGSIHTFVTPTYVTLDK